MTSSPADFRVVRKRLADGTVKEYLYPVDRKPPRERIKHAKDSIGALIEAYKISPEYKRLRPTTRDGYDRHLEIWRRFAGNPVKSITRRQVLHLRDAIASAPDGGPAAANTFISVTSRLLSWALDRDWIAATPAAKIKALDIGEYPAWTMEQAELAIAKLDERLRLVVKLALYTGQRRSDLVAMRWADIQGTVIRVVPIKTTKKKQSETVLRIPLHPELAKELALWRGRAQSAFILETERGRPWIPTYLSRILGLAVQKIGLPASLNLHGLRKLAASSLADAGSSTHEIAAVTGHKTLAMVQHYTRSASQERLAETAILRLQTAKTETKKPRRKAK